MAEIKIARVDFRLIHGQVVTRWLQVYPARYIVVIDDEIAEDEFMSEVLALAAPKEMELIVTSMSNAKKTLDEINSSVFLLFNSIEKCYEAVNAGIKFGELVVGGVPSEKGRNFITDGVYISAKEYEYLKEIEEKGTKIVLKSVPDEKSIYLSGIEKKIK